MKLPEVSVRNPVMTVMVFFAVVMLGFFSLSRLRIDLMPDIEPPQVSVITFWPGASATDVESSVTKYIEDQLTRVANLERLTSKSLDNFSVVNCRFKWGTDLDSATNDVRDALELAKRDLPEDVEAPMIFKFSTAVMPILFMFLTADESYPQLHYIADKLIADELRRVPGVGSIVIYAGLKREIKVEFDPKRLEAYGLSIEEVGRILKAENLDLPLGEVKLGRRAYAVRLPARFKDVEELKKVIVGVSQGRVVRLGDVAEVSDAFKDPMMVAYGDGRPGVVMGIQKQVGANTVEVADRVKEKLKEIEKGLPPDVKLVVVFDSSEYIRWSLQNLKEALYVGLILVAVVTFGFLRRVWASAIVLLTIPFSLIGAFILMYLFGYTMNTITLSALAIASGMVVDDAIVILENITRHLERGARPVPAAIFGTSEVGLAVTAATLTIVAVFVPLMFVTGLTGIFFKQLAFVITVAIMASLFNALTLTPMLSSKFLSAQGGPKGGIWGEVDRWLERRLEDLEGFYKGVLRWALDNRKKVIGLAAVVFSSSLGLLPFLGTELSPEMDSGEVTITLRLPEGARLEETQRVLEEINGIVREAVPEVRHFYAYGGQTEKGLATALGFEEGANVGTVGLRLLKRAERERSAKEVAMALRERIKDIPEIRELSVTAAPGIGQVLMGGRRRISVEVWGRDWEALYQVAQRLKEEMEKVPGAVDVTLSQRPPRPEFWVELDREKASSLGLNVALVAAQLRGYLYGLEPTSFREHGEDYDLRLSLGQNYKGDPEALGEVPIKSLSGRLVRLKNVARIKEAYGPVEIERRDRQRVVKVEADVFGRPLGEVVRDIRASVQRMELPKGIKVHFAGEAEEQQKAFRELRLLFALGAAMVYMVMASLFKSYRHPFVILFSLPFAVSGAIFALALTGTTLSLYSFLGIVMLLGIVTKNAIVLVDYTNILRERGFGLEEAITQAGRDRLRPVLMTTLTTWFGMLPMALSRGEGSEMWSSLGITMLGGLMGSTLLTLLLVPVVYYMVESRRRS